MIIIETFFKKKKNSDGIALNSSVNYLNKRNEIWAYLLKTESCDFLI